jgi:hypothetical protein
MYLLIIFDTREHKLEKEVERREEYAKEEKYVYLIFSFVPRFPFKREL